MCALISVGYLRSWVYSFLFLNSEKKATKLVFKSLHIFSVSFFCTLLLYFTWVPFLRWLGVFSVYTLRVGKGRGPLRWRLVLWMGSRLMRKPLVSNEVITGYSDSPEMTHLILLLWKLDLAVSSLGTWKKAGWSLSMQNFASHSFDPCILECLNCVFSPQKACFNIFRGSACKLLPGWECRVQAGSATLLLFFDTVFRIAQASLRLSMCWCWLQSSSSFCPLPPKCSDNSRGPPCQCCGEFLPRPPLALPSLSVSSFLLPTVLTGTRTWALWISCINRWVPSAQVGFIKGIFSSLLLNLCFSSFQRAFFFLLLPHSLSSSECSLCSGRGWWDGAIETRCVRSVQPLLLELWGYSWTLLSPFLKHNRFLPFLLSFLVPPGTQLFC